MEKQPAPPADPGQPSRYALPMPSPASSRARPANPRFVIRAGADLRVIIGAAASAVCFDIAARSGLATEGTAAWIVVAAVAVLLSGRMRGRTGRWLLLTAPVFGLVLGFRESPWVILPAVVAVAALFLLGVSVGADGGTLVATFPSLAVRAGYVAGHLALAPGMFRRHDEAASGEARANGAREAARMAGRSALLGFPVMLVIGFLLGLADPVFRSWFNLPSLALHLVFLLAGAWVAFGLTRAASAAKPAPGLPPAPGLGTAEAACVLAGMSLLYAAFVVAQFVALSGAGHRILVTQGMTYSQYARSGFFQLLACAAITFLVLLGVRACAKADHPVLMAFSALTAVLTIGVVIIAVRRLQLYESVYGLTMLRLACLVSAAWLGVVFLLLAATIPRRGLPQRFLPAAVLISGLVFIGGWSVSNPASIVAQTNLHRAEHGRQFDVNAAAGLGPDAFPALAGALSWLSHSQAANLRQAMCAAGTPTVSPGSGFNLSAAAAADARTKVCAKPPIKSAAFLWHGGVRRCGQRPLPDFLRDHHVLAASTGFWRGLRDSHGDQVGVRILTQPLDQALRHGLEPGLERGRGQAHCTQDAEQSLQESAG